MKILEEKIIRNFVYVTYLFGNNISHTLREGIIGYLEKVFCTNLTKEIREILLNEDFSMANLNLFMRRYQYMTLVNDEDLPKEKIYLEVYTLARESINSLNEAKIKNDDQNSSVLKCKEMLRKVLSENLVFVNFIYAMVNQIGLFTPIRKDVANEYLEKNGRWNDETSILCLAYNLMQEGKYSDSYYWYKIGMCISKSEDFQDYEKILKNITKKISKTELELVEKKLKKDLILHELLNDERASAQFNKMVYNPNIAAIIYEGSFSLSEKQRLLFSRQEIDFSNISLLVTKNEEEVLNKNSITNDFRVKEQEKLISILNLMIKSKNNGPLIIVSKNKAIIDIYSSMIEDYFKKHIVLSLDALRCDYRSLDRIYALNNYLYQNITEHQTSNIVIMYHNLHTIMEKDLVPFMSLLMKDSNYLIQDIKVSIDKSNLINIIFTMDINTLDKRIVQSSDVVVLDDANEDEKEEIVKVKLKNELERKNMEFKTEYEEIVKYISEKISYSKLNEVITKVVSRMLLSEEESIITLVNEFAQSKVIGF